MNQDLDFEIRIENLLSKLTLDEKISLLTKHTGFSTKPIERLNIPEFKMADGPHGVRSDKKNTYFPATIGLAATWNPDLAHSYGMVLAEETRANGKHCILAPGINIHRTPLNGRNFEYMTEDPLLNSKMVVPLIKGIQSKRIAACIKHFVCNNSEVRRRFSNSIVDERTMEEIYFPGFKAAVSEGDAWMIMGSYNKVNGDYVYVKKNLLIGKLRDEWNFKGFVVSDWLATHSMKNPDKCIKAGLTLEMPNAFVYNPEMVKKSYEDGKFKIEELDENIRRLLRVFFYVGLFDSEDKIPKGSRNTKEHITIARKIVQESSVLLKNDGRILPINTNKIKKICITGKLADYKPFIDVLGGSSSVNPAVSIKPIEAIKTKMDQINNRINMKNSSIELVKNPEDADIVILITGITHWLYYDNEGTDRKIYDLSKKKIKEIKKVISKNPNTVIVLYGGGPIGMSDWVDDVKGIMHVWQPHQEGSTVLADLIFGDLYPSGKLPTTFPKVISDSPAHANNKGDKTYPTFNYSAISMGLHETIYPHPKRTHKGKQIDIHYDEGIFIGYRYADKNKIEPQFPFGFGLSYTEFEISNIKTNTDNISENSKFSVFVDIKNIGTMEGAEVVQIYYNDIECSVERPDKELIGFLKVKLKSGEKSTIEIIINADQLRFYDVNSHSWILEKGEIKLLVGTSSKDIKMEKIISIN